MLERGSGGPGWGPRSLVSRSRAHQELDAAPPEHVEARGVEDEEEEEDEGQAVEADVRQQVRLVLIGGAVHLVGSGRPERRRRGESEIVALCYKYCLCPHQ